MTRLKRHLLSERNNRCYYRPSLKYVSKSRQILEKPTKNLSFDCTLCCFGHFGVLMYKKCFFIDLNLILYSTLMWSVKFHSMRICNHNAYDDHSSGYESRPSIPDVRPKGKMWSRKSGSCPEKKSWNRSISFEENGKVF